jgi:hypothetical protein
MDETSGINGSVTCPACDRGNEAQNLFCVHCGQSLPRAHKRVKPLILLLGVVGLVLAGVAWHIHTNGFGSQPLARINGEEITRREFSNRLDWTKRLYELRFGQDLFKGRAGKEQLTRLKAQLLEEMIVEKLLLQEAMKGGFTRAPEKEIEAQVEAIKQNHGLSEADFKERLGVTIPGFKEELKKDWVISQFIEKAVLKGNQDNREWLFQNWLSETKVRARIETYEKFDAPPPIQAACCPGGGCTGGEQARPLDPKIEKEATSKALQYYQEKTRRSGASARAINFGCHIQVDIIEGGKVVLSLTYDRGEVKEI